MRVLVPASALVLFLILVSCALCQQAPPAATPIQRDAKALAVLQTAAATMGKSAPGDSTAVGTVTTIAGSLTETGTAKILTRGTTQTSEQIQTPHGFTVVYSSGQASRV